MFNEDALLQILTVEMTLEQEYQALECTHGVRGARWKTPPPSEASALQMLGVHRVDADGQQAGGQSRTLNTRQQSTPK